MGGSVRRSRSNKIGENIRGDKFPRFCIGDRSLPSPPQCAVLALNKLGGGTVGFSAGRTDFPEKIEDCHDAATAIWAGSRYRIFGHSPHHPPALGTFGLENNVTPLD
jgi:hypothetical protein